jgi:hypothetical protein
MHRVTDAELQALAVEVRDTPGGPPEALRQAMLRLLGLPAELDGSAMAPSALPAGAFASDRRVDAREWVALYRGLTGACEVAAREALCEALTHSPPDADLRMPASSIPPLDLDEVTHRTAAGRLLAVIARGWIAATGAPCVVFRYVPEGTLLVIAEEAFRASGVVPLRAERDLPERSPRRAMPCAGRVASRRLAAGALARAARVTPAEWLRLRAVLTGEDRGLAEIALCLLLARMTPDADLRLPALSAVPPELNGVTHQHRDGSFHRQVAWAARLADGDDCILLRSLPEGVLQVWSTTAFTEEFVVVGDPAELSAPRR